MDNIGSVVFSDICVENESVKYLVIRVFSDLIKLIMK